MVNKPTKASRRPLVFLGVGAANTLLDFAFYTILTLTILKGQDSIALAGFVSGTFALLCAFIAHSMITWRGSSIGKGTILRFFLFTGFGMWVIRPLLLSFFIHFTSVYHFAYNLSTSLGLPFSYEFVTNTGAFGFMVVIILSYNYFVYDRFVFKKRT